MHIMYKLFKRGFQKVILLENNKNIKPHKSLITRSTYLIFRHLKESLILK